MIVPAEAKFCLLYDSQSTPIVVWWQVGGIKVPDRMPLIPWKGSFPRIEAFLKTLKLGFTRGKSQAKMPTYLSMS